MNRSTWISSQPIITPEPCSNGLLLTFDWTPSALAETSYFSSQGLITRKSDIYVMIFPMLANLFTQPGIFLCKTASQTQFVKVLQFFLTRSYELPGNLSRSESIILLISLKEREVFPNKMLYLKLGWFVLGVTSMTPECVPSWPAKVYQVDPISIPLWQKPSPMLKQAWFMPGFRSQTLRQSQVQTVEPSERYPYICLNISYKLMNNQKFQIVSEQGGPGCYFKFGLTKILNNLKQIMYQKFGMVGIKIEIRQNTVIFFMQILD